MARVAEFLDLVQPFLSLGFMVRHASVDEQKPAPGPQDARRFANERLRGTEVMRRDARGHEIETGVGVGKFLGRVLAGFHGEAALGGRFANTVEHGCGEIRAHDIVAKAGQMQAGMAGASGDIKNAGSCRQLDFFQGADDIGDVGQNMGTAVVAALTGELFLGGLLDGVELHGSRLKQTRAEDKSRDGSEARARA